MAEPPSPDGGTVRRSSHFVPGANERMLEKSIATDADSLVLDLEDAVTPDNKDSARATVFVDFRDDEGLAAECATSAATGFTGKITIHPAQIDIVNAAFTPSTAEVADARELLEAFAEAEAAGLMAFAHKGQMVDMPHLTRARKIVATAEAIAARP